MRTVYTVEYSVDGVQEDLEEEELRPLIVTQNFPARAAIVKGLKPGFQYLENRLLGNCEAPCAACPSPRAMIPTVAWALRGVSSDSSSSSSSRGMRPTEGSRLYSGENPEQAWTLVVSKEEK